MNGKYPQDPQAEFHLPDESRHYRLEMEHLRCPCGCMPWLMRRKIKANCWQFSVKCGNEGNYTLAFDGKSSFPVLQPCDASEPTPWLPNSQQAIAHWRMAKTLGAV